MPSSDLVPQQTPVAWIGTGVMGASMCGHLMDSGFPMTVTTRTRSKAEPLLARGAQWADTPRAAAAGADIIFSIVGHPSDVREVVFGPTGALAGCREGAVLVDMTTSQPAMAVEIAVAAQARGVTAIDAPVSGGDVGAKAGTLSIMIGGDQQAVERLAPCWEAMGSTAVWQGPAGSGQHTKMVNQTLVAAGMVGVCEALVYAYRAGLDLTTVLQSVSSGAAGSWALSNLGPRIVANDFAAGFFVEHFIKDLGIVLEECRRMEVDLPGVALAHRLYESVAQQGHERSGTQVLVQAVAELSEFNWAGRNEKPS